MALRAIRASDLPSIASWLPGVATTIGCDRWPSDDALRDALRRDDMLLYHDDAGEAFISYKVHSPRRNATRIEMLAVPADRRRLGIGSRAALALEKRLARPAKRIYVAVPAHIGLALYFWLRLGYRPLTQAEWPHAPENPPSAWMVRELS